MTRITHLKPNKRIVIDTNVIISAMILKESKPRKVLDWVIKNGRLLMSSELFSEIEDVADRERITKYLSLDEKKEFVDYLSINSEFISPNEQITACRDPKDDMILELATNGKAGYIITGDTDLLDLDTFELIDIITPHNFFDLIS